MPPLGVGMVVALLLLALSFGGVLVASGCDLSTSIRFHSPLLVVGSASGCMRVGMAEVDCDLAGDATAAVGAGAGAGVAIRSAAEPSVSKDVAGRSDVDDDVDEEDSDGFLTTLRVRLEEYCVLQWPSSAARVAAMEDIDGERGERWLTPATGVGWADVEFEVRRLSGMSSGSPSRRAVVGADMALPLWVWAEGKEDAAATACAYASAGSTPRGLVFVDTDGDADSIGEVGFEGMSPGCVDCVLVSGVGEVTLVSRDRLSFLYCMSDFSSAVLIDGGMVPPALLSMAS